MARSAKEQDRIARRLLLPVLGVCVVIYVSPIAVYSWGLGLPLFSQQDVWGQFGDFVGGLLNPIFSLFAFVAVLVAMWFQRQDFERELQFLRDIEAKDDVYKIIVQIYNEMTELLDTPFHGPGTTATPSATLRTIAAEADRQQPTEIKVGAYAKFLPLANDASERVGHYYLTLVRLAHEMHHYLEIYEQYPGEPRHVVSYYARFAALLLPLFNGVGSVRTRTLEFFTVRGSSMH